MRFSVRHADRIVGAFILLAMVFLVVILFLLGSNQRWFARSYHYRSRFLSANSLNVGTGILFKGFEIGKISNVTLNGDNQVDVDFFVYDTYADRVNRNCVLELSVSPIGLGTSLLFHRGFSTEALPEDSWIPSLDLPEGQNLVEQSLVDIPRKDDTVTRLLASVNGVLDGLNRTLLNLNLALEGKGTGEIQEILKGVKVALASLDGTLKTANGALADVDGLVVNVNGMAVDIGQALPGVLSQIREIEEQVSGVVSQVDAAMANLVQTTESLKDPTGLVPKLLGPGDVADLLGPKSGLSRRIDGILSDVGRTTASLDSMAGQIAGEVPRLSAILMEARNVLEQTRDVMEGLRNNPLLSGGIPSEVRQGSSLGSLRDEEF